MKIDLSVRKVAPEEMADGKAAIGMFLTKESGPEYVATLPIEKIDDLAGVANTLRFFAACVDNLSKGKVRAA